MDVATLISFVAGGLVAIAALPKVIGRAFDKNAVSAASYADIMRDSLIVCGNLLWVAFGIYQNIPALILFGGISASLTGILVAQNLGALVTRGRRI